ncbi:MAG: hypothetical protein H7070_03950 [Saprospiraceae bacterium]|nr:hypothetical protein [Pyrinomonadaceae bacterium]
MINEVGIDTKFDFRTDATGPDPDNTSPTLKRYHQFLWSKFLPNGKIFNLDSESGNGYLYHKSELGEFVLTSDSVLPTFSRRKRYALIEQIPHEDVAHFDYITYTIGGMMIFPGNKIDGRMTINGARGCHQIIADRFDLTVECIRRYYGGEESPLYAVLARYDSFFRLFSDFKGYVDFFLLQDLVVGDYSAVRFFTPFNNFQSSPLPQNIEAYTLFRERTIAFVESRNDRILAHCADHPQTHRGQ